MLQFLGKLYSKYHGFSQCLCVKLHTFKCTCDISRMFLLSYLVGEALLNFRNAIVSSDGILPLWRPEDPDPCNWRGVTCDQKTKRVIYL